MMPTSRLGLGVRDALSEGAALAQRIPGFVARPAQQRLAVAAGGPQPACQIARRYLFNHRAALV